MSLRNGAPWRDLPERFGPSHTVYDHFRDWPADATYDRFLKALQIQLDRKGKLDWDLWCIDGSSVRASRASAGADIKVPNATPKSRPTTFWTVREAYLQASSIWLLTAEACR